MVTLWAHYGHTMGTLWSHTHYGHTMVSTLWSPVDPAGVLTVPAPRVRPLRAPAPLAPPGVARGRHHLRVRSPASCHPEICNVVDSFRGLWQYSNKICSPDPATGTKLTKQENWLTIQKISDKKTQWQTYLIITFCPRYIISGP